MKYRASALLADGHEIEAFFECEPDQLMILVEIMNLCASRIPVNVLDVADEKAIAEAKDGDVVRVSNPTLSQFHSHRSSSGSSHGPP